MQRPQHTAITAGYPDTWAIYPSQPGQGHNVVAWRTTDWRLVEGRTFTIPYFDGHPAPQAAVQLRHRVTGQRVWVLSVHNPADTPAHPRQAPYRARALRIELALVRQLQSTGLTGLLVGDFNDVDQPHCTFTPLMANAYGPGHHNPCQAPAKAGIDQIYLLGTATLTNTIKDRTLKTRHLTDHPLVSTTIRLREPPSNGLAAPA